ncbi:MULTISPECIES: Xaa-Pro peptidase family protein [unclassified Imperialibacter]|uniref:M24 family metallopeptidase n=1 Tax=unclassified Imperialibacter TaxID=2629706 RepID=UPI0012551EA2|nr:MULTISPECIES: M24 family metallopeptidase [unclassified Imperialibacter]CAD5254896.1 Peptidase M24 [Imperialibacter sp. 75]CAD5263405.1 Peptidase M24 [Imperialibacter sp. 89]VVT35445.1 Peptidase M24 [Imperialibacter sp. EC-SDR9]
MRILLAFFMLLVSTSAFSQEAMRRWRKMNQVRNDKFDLVLPEAMRENNIDMWIIMNREGNFDPLYPDMGEGYVGSVGYYIFTDRGSDRIERSVLGIDGYLLEEGGAYDYFGSASELKAFVEARDPKRIGLNMSKNIGGADGLSHSGYLELAEVLGKKFEQRFVSAEKLASDFRSRRVAGEIAIYGEAGELSYTLAERALSNEVITPGVTTLEDVAWWMKEQLFKNNLESSFGMPSVYVTGPEGIAATSTDRIIQRGDVLFIDWGVGLMNMYTDMKRMAYVLKEGETGVPPGIQNAFEQAVKVRDVVKQTIKPGVTAQKAEDAVYEALTKAGFNKMAGFNKPTELDKTDVIIGCHSVGNWGHGIGPSIAFFNPLQLGYEIKPSNLLSIEFFAYTKVPEWGGKKLRVALEDDAIITARGVEWLYPINPRVLLIK